MWSLILKKDRKEVKSDEFVKENQMININIKKLINSQFIK